jgi:Zn-dependent protease/CBS domain-containing protein
MRQTLRLGRVAGIPVGVNWTVFVILALIANIVAQSILPRAESGRPAAVYWAIGIPTALLFLASLLAHEIAHALVARRRGVPVRSITLWVLGGVTQLGGETRNARADLEIAAAGPLASLAAGGVLILATFAAESAGAPALIGTALGWIGAMNLLLAVFNLLPGAPLDGGRILRALSWMRHGDRARADRVATRAGQVLGGALIGAGLAQALILGQINGLWLSLVGWFLIWAAGMEGRTAILREAAEGMRMRDLMFHEPDCVPAWSPIGRFVDAVALGSRQSVFPVVGMSGVPMGVVTLERLAAVPAAHTGERVESVAVPLPPEYVADPDDPVTSVLGRQPLAGAVLAVVMSHGRVVGMITIEDLDWLIRQSRLRQRAPAA